MRHSGLHVQFGSILIKAGPVHICDSFGLVLLLIDLVRLRNYCVLSIVMYINVKNCSLTKC